MEHMIEKLRFWVRFGKFYLSMIPYNYCPLIILLQIFIGLIHTGKHTLHLFDFISNGSTLVITDYQNNELAYYIKTDMVYTYLNIPLKRQYRHDQQGMESECLF